METIRFEKIPYQNLNARQKEVFNFHKIAATLADFGFNSIKLNDDWQGADFLAYHVNGTTTLKVQLKSRVTVEKKYCGKDIWMAFPHKGFWYLVEHDDLLQKVGVLTDWLKSQAWQGSGKYSSVAVNPDLLNAISGNRLGPVYGQVLEEDGEQKAVATRA